MGKLADEIKHVHTHVSIFHMCVSFSKSKKPELLTILMRIFLIGKRILFYLDFEDISNTKRTSKAVRQHIQSITRSTCNDWWKWVCKEMPQIFIRFPTEEITTYPTRPAPDRHTNICKNEFNRPEVRNFLNLRAGEVPSFKNVKTPSSRNPLRR